MTGPGAWAQAELVEELWQRFQPLASQRVRALEEYAGACAEGRATAAERATAAKAAHDLEGGLGSYGRPEGSRWAAAFLVALPEAGSDPRRLAEVAAQLRSLVGQ